MIMKRKHFQLNEHQRMIVENNLAIVHKVIRDNIIVNESIFGFSYNDIFQEGCIWLCKAVITYVDNKDVKIETYAYKVVSNGLRTYCRLMCNKQKQIITAPLHADEEIIFALNQITDEDSFEERISQIDTFALLNKMKRQYTGTVRLGIEAIEWKVKGFSGREIAKIYGVKQNLVGAWISRASTKLLENEEFMSFLGRNVEKCSS